LPNLGDVTARGIWFPHGYDKPIAKRGSQVTIEFSNLRCDGDIRSKWDVLIVGDFALSFGGRTICWESEFCLVEPQLS
jgi:hypothetical protein